MKMKTDRDKPPKVRSVTRRDTMYGFSKISGYKRLNLNVSNFLCIRLKQATDVT